MPSTVSITNQALILLGTDPILSLDDDVKSATLANAIFADTVDEVLRSHFWNSATKRDSIAELDEDISWGFSHIYQLPTDFLRIYPQEGSLRDQLFRIENKKLLTDVTAPLNIKYVFRLESESDMDPLLAFTVACRLAWKLALTLTGSKEIMAGMRQLYDDAIRQARFFDSSDGPMEELEAEDWINSRFSGGRTSGPITESS